MQSTLGWDTKLSSPQLDEWARIVKQANASPRIEIDRSVGERDGEYELICFADASKVIYAAVVYIRDTVTGKTTFLLGKNRFVNKQLELKSIPNLELQAIVLAAETVIECKKALCGENVVCPVNITKCSLYTDSMIALQWINLYSHKHDKMQRQSVFVVNRLRYLVNLCKRETISFSFTETEVNPADCLTRPLSYNLLAKSNYIQGPSSLESDSYQRFTVTLPYPEINIKSKFNIDSQVIKDNSSEQILNLERFSSLKRLVKVYLLVRKFCNKLKDRVLKTTKTKAIPVPTAIVELIKIEQKHYFSEELNWLSSVKPIGRIPKRITKMNIFLDSGNILRVKSKFGRFSEKLIYQFFYLTDLN